MKRILVIALALFMLVSLAACGLGGGTDNPGTNTPQGTQSDNQGNSTTNNSGDNSESGQNNDKGLNGASKENYASLLKEYFGFNSEDIEEASFTLSAARGSYFPQNDVQYLFTLEYENTDLATSKAYTQKMFELTKTLSTTGSVFAAVIENNMLVKGTNEYTDFNLFHDTEKNNSTWYYNWNGKDICLVITAAFTVKVQFSYSDN